MAASKGEHQAVTLLLDNRADANHTGNVRFHIDVFVLMYLHLQCMLTPMHVHLCTYIDVRTSMMHVHVLTFMSARRSYTDARTFLPLLLQATTVANVRIVAARISLSFKRDFENDHSKLRILVDSRLENQRIWRLVVTATVHLSLYI